MENIKPDELKEYRDLAKIYLGFTELQMDELARKKSWLRLCNTDEEGTMTKTYSKSLAALHENVSDLYHAGVIDKKTMQKFDRSCLTPLIKLTPARHSKNPRQGRGQPGCLCGALECHNRHCQQMGARRKGAERPRSKVTYARCCPRH